MFRDVRDSPSHEAPLPSLQPVQWIEELRALDFLAGREVEALDALCRDLDGARRVATGDGYLITTMVAIGAFRQQASLLAEMRVHAPDAPLPVSCAALAEAPDPAVDGTLCRVMRGEFRWVQGNMRSIHAAMATTPSESGAFHDLIEPLLHDEAWSLARTAQSLARTCGPEAEAAARDDRAISIAAPPLRWVDRVAFSGSAVVTAIAEPAYTMYSERQLDFLAARRLLAAYLQMAAMDPALTAKQRFDALPAALRDGPRPLVIADDGASIAVPLRADRFEPEPTELRFALPRLPPDGNAKSATGVNMD